MSKLEERVNTIIFIGIFVALVGLGIYSSVPSAYLETNITPKTEGYVELPTIYNTLSDSLATIQFKNNGTSADLTYADEQVVNFTTLSLAKINWGWQLSSICDNFTDLVNATMNMTFFSNASFTMELIIISQLTNPSFSMINLSVTEGKNTFDNLTIIGEGGIFENITSALAYPLICNRNGGFYIQTILPVDISIALDQIVCLFYAKNLSGDLYTQFFDVVSFDTLNNTNIPFLLNYDASVLKNTTNIITLTLSPNCSAIFEKNGFNSSNLANEGENLFVYRPSETGTIHFKVYLFYNNVSIGEYAFEVSVIANDDSAFGEIDMETISYALIGVGGIVVLSALGYKYFRKFN